MGVVDWLRNLLGGADEHVQNLTDAVQSIDDTEVAQNLQDKTSELNTQAKDIKNNLVDHAEGTIDGLKDKLPK